MTVQDSPHNIQKPESWHRGREGIALTGARQAPYRLHGSYPDQTHCTACGVVFEGGKWSWPHQLTSGKQLVNEVICPACRREQDSYPAGWLTLSGAYFREHRDDVFSLIRVEERLERDEHPLNRIIGVERTADAVTITTSDTHLPRRLARAIQRANGGDVTEDYSPGEEQVRITWQRNDVPAASPRVAAQSMVTGVKANGLIVTPEANAYLSGRMERLQRFYPRLLEARVTLDAPEGHHRKGGPYSVSIHVQLPGKDAHVTRQDARNLHVAIRNAFDAAERQLEDIARRQRGDVSPTVRPERGKVVRVYSDRGYGFLQAEDGHEVYFKDSSVLEGMFAKLQEGDVVAFHQEAGEFGPQASSVHAG